MDASSVTVEFILTTFSLIFLLESIKLCTWIKKIVNIKNKVIIYNLKKL